MGKGKKRTISKKVSGLPIESKKGVNIEKTLIENFVATQRVMVNLAGKLDNLTNQVSKLLELFEISAKALAEKNFQISGDKGNEKIVQKIDTLLDQNKTIARGLTLMHELNPRAEQQPHPQYPAQPYPAPSARVNEGITGYQKSIASGENASNFESPISNNKRFKKLP